MSAELEKEPKDDIKEVPHIKSLKKQTLEKLPFILKVSEIIISIICLILTHDASCKVELARKHIYRFGIIYSAYATYMIVNAIFLSSTFAKPTKQDKIPYKIDCVISLVASVHFFLAALLLIIQRGKVFDDWLYAPHYYMVWWIIAATMLSFLNMIIFATDAVLTFLKKGEW